MTNFFVALLECQQCGARDPPHVLRVKCFYVFKLALETKRGKLISLAINGIYVSIFNVALLQNVV